MTRVSLRLPGSCGAFAVSLLLLVAFAGGGTIYWAMFGPLLVLAFLVVFCFVYFVVWLADALTGRPGPALPTGRAHPAMRWPDDFPKTQWLLHRCFTIAAVAIALCLSLAWSGLSIWKGWTTLETVSSVMAVIAAAIIGVLWSEAVYWLLRNSRRSWQFSDPEALTDMQSRDTAPSRSPRNAVRGIHEG